MAQELNQGPVSLDAIKALNYKIDFLIGKLSEERRFSEQEIKLIQDLSACVDHVTSGPQGQAKQACNWSEISATAQPQQAMKLLRPDVVQPQQAMKLLQPDLVQPQQAMKLMQPDQVDSRR